MLKPGIWRQDQFQRKRSWLGSERLASYSLLRLPGAASDEDVARFEKLTSALRLSSGVYRTTRRGRFERLDQAVQKLLADLFDSGGVVRLVSLVHPSYRREMADSGWIGYRTHSVFQVAPRICQVVRTMNIFNPGYFEAARLTEGFRCVRDSLADGGVWVVGRSVDEESGAAATSVYRKVGGRFETVLELCGGYECDDLVKALGSSGAADQVL